MNESFEIPADHKVYINPQANPAGSDLVAGSGYQQAPGPVPINDQAPMAPGPKFIQAPVFNVPQPGDTDPNSNQVPAYQQVPPPITTHPQLVPVSYNVPQSPAQLPAPHNQLGVTQTPAGWDANRGAWLQQPNMAGQTLVGQQIPTTGLDVERLKPPKVAGYNQLAQPAAPINQAVRMIPNQQTYIQQPAPQGRDPTSSPSGPAQSFTWAGQSEPAQLTGYLGQTSNPQIMSPIAATQVNPTLPTKKARLVIQPPSQTAQAAVGNNLTVARPVHSIPSRSGGGLVYSHNEKLKKKHHLSGFVMRVLVFCLMGGAVSGSFIVLPKINAWWGGFQMNDEKQVHNVFTELLTNSSHSYDIRLESYEFRGLSDDTQRLIGLPTTASDKSVLVTIEGSFTSDYSNYQNDIHFDVSANNSVEIEMSTITDANSRDQSLKIDGISRGSQQKPLPGLDGWRSVNKSILANSNYHSAEIINGLMTNYNFAEYSLLLPNIHIPNKKDRQQVAKNLQVNKIYQVQDCVPSIKTKPKVTTCQISVDKESLYDFYQTVYEQILDQEIPSYYSILSTANVSDQGAILPSSFRLKIDTQTDLPISLVADLATTNNISGDFQTNRLIINYKDFKIPKIVSNRQAKLLTAQDLLVLDRALQNTSKDKEIKGDSNP